MHATFDRQAIDLVIEIRKMIRVCRYGSWMYIKKGVKAIINFEAVQLIWSRIKDSEIFRY